MDAAVQIGQKKVFTGLDVMKFIMALFIMNIHLQFTNFLPMWAYSLFIEPLEQSAVPLFFILSAFFLFRKVESAEKQWPVIKKFIKRLLILYLFWMVVWSPYIAMNPDYRHAASLLAAVGLFLKDFFFYAVYGNSWFFPALIFGVLFVWGLRRLMGFRWLWIIPTLLFIYLYAIDLFPAALRMPVKWYWEYLATPTQSFPRGIFWITMGYYLSRPNWQTFIEKIDARRSAISIPFLVLFVGAIGLMGTMGAFSSEKNSALSVLLYPILDFVLFVVFYKWIPNISLNISQWLRAMSILTFVMHGTAEKVFRVILHWEHGPVLYLTMLACCLIVGTLIFYLSKRRGFHWLRWAY